jgi:hypothetical protein
MSSALTTTVSPTQRTISVLLESGETERYALAQTREGDLFWRQDTFAGAAWVGHGGRLTVGDVVARVPSCARHVVAWTRAEIELGADLPDADVFVRAIRRDALARLTRELVTALPSAA